MTRTWNIAVLGCGAIVRRAHLPGLLASGAARVPVIFGPDTANSHQTAAAFGIPRLVHSLEEAIATPGLDAVVVALPNHQHGPAALAAIAAGLPVLLEKPIASDIATARAIVAAAEAAGVRTVMSLPQRQRPSLRHLKDLAATGTLGRVESIDIRMIRRAGIPGHGGWFTQKALAGGGVLMDLGPHVLDTAFWLAGCTQVDRLTARTWRTHGPHGRGLGDWGSSRVTDTAVCDVEDRAWLAMELACGTQVTCELAWAAFAGEENRVRLVGTRGGADYWPERHGPATPLRLYRDGGDGRPADADAPLPADHDPLDAAWASIAATFVADLARERSQLVNVTEALIAAELIQRIYDAGPDTRHAPATG